ncbi:MAG: Spy/CpxP family protein refolding chaperone [Acidobacteria bacterium]|nr:Spy/CpxP family protein refolding chaperone [Acidobacteriota bacterium]
MNKTFGSPAALLFALALSLFFIIFSDAQARAQGGDAAQQPQQSDPAQATGAREGRGRDPLRELNLTFDQLQQIRAIREQNREEWRAVRQRLAEAFRALDEAVYSDNVNDALIEERARELGSAQAAVSRMRALTELKIRRVLTPEQLNTLRAMRQQARASERNSRRENGLNARPLRRRAPLGRGEGDGRALRGRRP